MANVQFLDKVPVGRIYLLHSNPRHEPFETEGEAIKYLCENEDVYALARDIVNLGMNPLETCGIIPADKKKSGGTYFVAEGNRRICALKLLNDPELAPTKLRNGFRRLAENWTPIKFVRGARFEDIEDIKVWLDRTHNGPQGGIGRRQWNAEQKSRFDGDNKNRPSQALLDYAEKEKMISAEDRKGKLTTVQRFLSNDVFREAMGFDQSNPDDVGRSRPKPEFDAVVKRFMSDLVGKEKVHSRMNKAEIIEYARPLNSLPGVTTTRVEPESLTTDSPTGQPKKTRKKKPKKPDKAAHVHYDEEIFQALRAYGNDKLESLYHSICDVKLDPHTPLVCIGAWAFFETLTACAGRHEKTPFPSFLQSSKLTSYGITGKTTALKEALERIGGYGNTTKHHPVSASFNGDQLNNDFIALKDVILKCINEAAQKAS
ncbi:hypothetical protein [Parasphingorhabdus sp.]|uniref:hypothetical protein n=1 Tax=Parasphingorhabdus sp. TaxID=2709688 RepID=UPI003001DCCC